MERGDADIMGGKMAGDAPEQIQGQTRETIVFTRVVGAALVLILIFGVLNLSGVIHAG
jgi:hypothetical protein